ncbi:MAG: DUF2062 domain-containing protein [Pseudomonadales bacterium]
MARKFLRRYLPDPSEVSGNPALRPVSRWLKNPEIWHMHRRSIAGATFIGLFCAFLPIPFQMVVAAALAILARCNLPLSVTLVWISNPITIPPIFYFTYRLGAWLLNMEVSVDSVDLSWDWLTANLDTIGYPLIFGSLLCGWVAGVTGFVLVRVSWRLHVISRWRDRKAARQARKAAASGSQ